MSGTRKHLNRLLDDYDARAKVYRDELPESPSKPRRDAQSREAAILQEKESSHAGMGGVSCLRRLRCPGRLGHAVGAAWAAWAVSRVRERTGGGVLRPGGRGARRGVAAAAVPERGPRRACAALCGLRAAGARSEASDSSAGPLLRWGACL